MHAGQLPREVIPRSKSSEVSSVRILGRGEADNCYHHATANRQAQGATYREAPTASMGQLIARVIGQPVGWRDT